MNFEKWLEMTVKYYRSNSGGDYTDIDLEEIAKEAYIKGRQEERESNKALQQGTKDEICGH